MSERRGAQTQVDDESLEDSGRPTSEAADTTVEAAPAATAGQRENAPSRNQGLFQHSNESEYRDRWSAIQGRFVDEPKQAVQQADDLVKSVMEDLLATFASERKSLEKEWAQDGETSTEVLRVTFQRYRTFFDRLLAA
jgi:hypothetical protein